ncbi:protein STRUBBELIG-RECEPTOR FAMILY 3-like [Quillaja saponaria]|uniref:Protein STRUBBELIG-RECEPTOR FAMILY 3-like n=1 Tax=Quillaja saponaria TaxID=32244 RepID=A0AAD7M3R7_QUISA|nr:protein STRUBBELIG-RECEPTOR FAMILY 3-like [Quillaja saponaria]
MGYVKRDLYTGLFIWSMLILQAAFSVGDTDLRDVAAINNLFASLGFPPLEGWQPTGGDPCLEKWQGVDCVFSNITAIRLRGMNLGGQLGNSLVFQSIIDIDFSNNHIGGPIPSTLPLTIRNFSLSANQLTGSIPYSISSLTQLSDLSINNNLLTGGIPDAFQQLTGLLTLDLSDNNLSGQLPPSMGTLSYLTELHLQNNQLSGTLYVLQALPLQDLNVENNLFSGPIPPKLLSIPNFREDGNPFNTTIIPSPPAASPSPVTGAPSSEDVPWKHANGPSVSHVPTITSARKFLTAKRVIWIAVAGVLIFVALGLLLFMLCYSRRRLRNQNAKRLGIGVYKGPSENSNYRESPLEATNQGEKVHKEAAVEENRRMDSIPKFQDEHEIHIKKVAATSAGRQPVKYLNPSSLEVYNVASLQQYTSSFSQEHFIGEGTLGSVYRAELPDGLLLAVKNLDTASSKEHSHNDFFELVRIISRIQHANVVKFLGYCAEHDKRLLVYEYCQNGTLYDALHVDNEIHKKLSWSTRIRVALGAARALEYMHEGFQPPIVHRNFKSSNVLLNDGLEVRVSDCGLASLLLSSGSAGQLSGRLLISYGYSAPEFESGSYTHQSDVYSFGVVMLELLTGHKSFDRQRPRGQQFLVRWAVPQLHDIDALSRMVDPSLNGAYPMKSLSRFADIISSCVQREPEFRPAMSEVVQDLLRMV